MSENKEESKCWFLFEGPNEAILKKMEETKGLMPNKEEDIPNILTPLTSYEIAALMLGEELKNKILEINTRWDRESITREEHNKMLGMADMRRFVHDCFWGNIMARMRLTNELSGSDLHITPGFNVALKGLKIK